MIKKNVFRAILFMLILVVLLEGVSYLLMPRNKRERGLLNEPANTIDYLVIGDSESITSISPMEIWHQYGYTGYDCGSSAQRLQETYYDLEGILKIQSPKVILLETNAFYRADKDNKEPKKIIEGYVQKLLPIFRYKNQWKNINYDTIKGYLFSRKYKGPDPFKGLNYKTMVNPYVDGDYVKATDEREEIKEAPLRYLNKIVELCKEKDIALILYSAPSPICWSFAKYNSNADFAKKHQLPYIDFNLIAEDISIDWSKDTCDKGNHINFYGAKKVTAYIGEYLSKNYELDDHRQESNYSTWNSGLEAYLKETKQDSITIKEEASK